VKCFTVGHLLKSQPSSLISVRACYSENGEFVAMSSGTRFRGPNELWKTVAVFRLVNGKVKLFNCYVESTVMFAQLGVLMNLQASLKN
jgi:hypothetical protein